MDGLAHVSIVVPVHNEEGTIASLVDLVAEVMAESGADSYELVIVDDGSTDRTLEEVGKAAKRDRHVKPVVLRKNFGKAAALSAGFECATGDPVITMDGDLQDDPREIPLFLKKIEDGYDLVSGWKKDRNDPLEKRLASKIFNAVSAGTTGVRIHDFNCGFKAYRAWCLEGMALHGNTYRFLPALVADRGGRVTELPVRHHKRTCGKSKYGLGRYFEGALDLLTVLFLTRFQRHPLYLFGMLALPLLATGLLTGGYLLFMHIVYVLGAAWGVQLVVRPLLNISISLFGFGVLVVLVGLVCELVLRQNPSYKSYWIRERDPSLQGREPRDR